MSRVMRSLAVVLCCVVVANIVLAQAQEEKKPIGISLQVGAQATDNRDSAPDGQEEDNVDIFARPRVDLMYSSESAVLDLYYAPSYRWRSDPSAIQNEDEWHHDLNVDGRLRVAERTTLRARERFNYTDDPEITEGDVNLRRDSSYLMNRAEVGISHDLTDRLNMDLLGKHMVKRYDDDQIADNYDEQLASAELAARQKLSQTLVGMGIVGAEMVDYEEINGVKRGYDSVLAGVGVEKMLSEMVSVHALGGVQYAEYDDPTISSETAPLVRLGAMAKVSDTVRFTARATHKLDNAYSYPYTSQRHTSVYGTVLWNATARLDLSAFAEYRYEKYEADTVNPALAVNSGDETTVLGVASATYKLLSKTKVSLSYVIEDVDSDVSTTFTRNAGTLSVTQDF